MTTPFQESEWVVLHALIHLRQFRRYERQQRERVWADDDAQPKAADVLVGMLGLGVLGMDAALKSKGLRIPGCGLERYAKVRGGN